jgi:hypothetical protein
MNKDDEELLETVAHSFGKTLWWCDFIYKIRKQGWMSDKQRRKLKSFDSKANLRPPYGEDRGYDPSGCDGPADCGIQWD